MASDDWPLLVNILNPYGCNQTCPSSPLASKINLEDLYTFFTLLRWIIILELWALHRIKSFKSLSLCMQRFSQSSSMSFFKKTYFHFHPIFSPLLIWDLDFSTIFVKIPLINLLRSLKHRGHKLQSMPLDMLKICAPQLFPLSCILFDMHCPIMSTY